MAITIRLAAALALAAALVALPNPSAAQDGDPIATIGIDTRPPADPRADLSGDPQTCVRVDEGETVDIAVFTSAVPDSRGISGFEFSLTFEPELVTVTATDPALLLAQAEGSDVLSIGEEESEDGELLVGVADFGPLGIEPEGASESGPGLLLGLTLTGGAVEGTGDLTIGNIIITDDANGVIPVDSNPSAVVAANADCPAAGASPTPQPSQDPEDGSGSTALVVGLSLAVLVAVAGGALAYRFWQRRRPRL